MADHRSRPTRRAAVAIAAGLLVCATAPAGVVGARQTAAPATAVISGRVIDGTTSAPVPGATLTLSKDPSDGERMPAREVMADAQGRFAFVAVPPGRFRLAGRRTGWAGGVHGVDHHPMLTSEPGLPARPERVRFTLEVRPGERVTATVPLWRDAVLSGRVTTEAGEPLPRARVRAVQWSVFMGRRSLNGPLAFADDRGEFSIAVPPGDYLLSAESDEVRVRGVTPASSGERFVFARAFHPSSPVPAGATLVRVAAGDERSGLDLILPAVPARRVAGVLRSVDGAARPSRIRLVSQEEHGGEWPAPVGPDGRFAFEHVAAGRYVIATLSAGGMVTGGRGAAANAGWVRAQVEVGAHDLELAVDVHRSLRVSGVVRFDGAAGARADVSAFVTLTRENEPAGSDLVPPRVPVGADGRFSVEVTPGRYLVTAGASAATAGGARQWRLQSAISGGRDVADVPLVALRDVSDLVLTLADQSAELHGRVSNAGAGNEEPLVILFPADESLWLDFGLGRRHRAMRPTPDGTFAFTGLAAGDYLVAAVWGASEVDVRVGRFFDALAPAARRVSLAEGLVTSQDLRADEAPTPPAAHLAPPPRPLDAVDAAEHGTAPAGPRRGGTIAGRVIDASSNDPIASMRVSLLPTMENSVTTDEQGRFLLMDVPAGQHTVHTLKPTYVPTIYGARRADEPGTPVAVAEGEQVAGITIAVMRGASIAGTVADEYGGPMAGVEVGIRQSRWRAQGRELVPVRSPGRIGPILTDRRGQFRIDGLAAGEYVLTATSRALEARTPVALTTQAPLDAAAFPPIVRTGMYAPVFYPDAADAARGDRLRLEAGELRVVHLQMPLVTPATVSGVVHGPDGQTLGGVGVQLLTDDPLLAGGGRLPRLSSSDTSGAFTIDGVLPGRYTLTTRGALLVLTAAPRLAASASLDIVVTGDIDGLALDMRPASTISGRIRTDASEAPPPLANVRIMASRLGAPAGAADATFTTAWDAQGQFTFGDLRPGRYRLTLTGTSNTTLPRLAAQVAGGADTLDAGIEVAPGAAVTGVDLVVATTPSPVSGAVRTRDGRPAAGHFVVLFARQPEAWVAPSLRVFGVQTDQTGRFVVRDVPPGDYWIARRTDGEPNQWFDPDLLSSLVPVSTPVAVRAGGTPEIDLRLP